MAFKFEEKFQVNAPVERVWQYLKDPRQVVLAMPGAELVEVVDERTFVGKVKVKVGPVTVSYQGQVRFTEVDDAAHQIRMVGEGRETAGAGSAKVTMVAGVFELPTGGAEARVSAEFEMVGKIVQMGRGMVEDVARMLFAQFAERARQQLETPVPAAAVAVGVGAGGPEAPAAARPAAEPDPVDGLVLVLRAIWRAIVRFVRRLLRAIRQFFATLNESTA